MAETLHKLQHIYAKWETRSPRQGGYGRPSQTQPDGCRSTTEGGKQAWTRKFGNIGPAPVRRQKYSRGKPCALSTAIVTSSSLGFFKSTPTVLPSVAQVRPLLGRCCTCMPSCREDLYNEDMKEMPLQNLLRSSTQIHCNGTTKTFSVYQLLRDNHSYKYPDVAAAARRNERVKHAIETSIHSELDETESDALCVTQVRAALKLHRRFVSTSLRQMKARVSDRLVRLSAWLLHRLLACVFSAVLIHSGQMTIIQKASERDLPLIFVPTRRSYFDHILLSFVLVSHGMRAPHVALGSESRISVFRRMFQWLGAFFSESRSHSNLAATAIYDAVLCSYVEELLRRHQHLGLFVEGQRSTNGRTQHPTGDLLSGVVSAYYEGAMTDAYIVPVSFSYEKLPEGTFSDRQLGGVETTPSLTGAIWCVWRLLRERRSSVRIDFCQPFLLREFLHVASSFERLDLGDDEGMRDEDGEDSEAEDDTVQCRCDAGDSRDIVLSDEHINSATVLAQHVAYDCENAQAVMCTHLLSFLLLNKYRQGARLPNLMSSFDWLKKEVVAHGRDLGFTGSTDAVVEHARQLLGPALVKHCPVTDQVDPSETNAAACLQPIISLPGVLDLAYYAQAAASVFVMESIVANVIHSMADPSQRSTDDDLDRSVPVSKQAVLEQCKTLCGQLKYDYVFMPPCGSVESHLGDALEQFLLCEVLQEEMVLFPKEVNTYTDNRERAWAQRVSASLSLGVCDEDQEEEGAWGAPDTLYKVNLSTPYTAEKFEFLRGVIAPTLETHYVTSCCLATLLDTPRTESEFVTNTLKVLVERVETSVATYEESASLDAVNNAVRSFVHQSVMQCYYDNDNGVKTVCLRGAYRDLPSLEKFIASLERYRT